MQSLGRILVAGAIVVLILGFVALPSTLGYYGHQQSKHNGMDHSAMMQENSEVCQHTAKNMHQRTCHTTSQEMPYCSHNADHGMMDCDASEHQSQCSGNPANSTACKTQT